jgi:outer membrane protein assembly factor BamB/tetratricopeptide (TPR) repeat protein
MTPRGGLRPALAIAIAAVAIGNAAVGSDEDRAAPARVLVPFRSETARDLEQAERLAARGDPLNALELYKELMRVDRTALFPAGGGRFVPVAEEVQRRLARLPAETLKAYRAEIDPEADRLLAAGRAGDLSALLGVAARFRQATAGPEAVALAAARLSDEAAFARAARMWSLWLDSYPSQPPARRAAVMVRLAGALVMAGDLPGAREVAGRLRREHPDAAVTAAGRRVNAADYAAALAARPPAVAVAPPVSDDRPMWPGDPTGTRLGGRADVVLLPRWVTSASPDGDDGDRERERLRRNTAVAIRNLTGAEAEWERPVPAVVGDAVFLRFAAELRAVSLTTGKILWRAAGDGDADAGGLRPEAVERGDGLVRFATGVPLERGRLSVTVADGRVFALDAFPPESIGPEGWTQARPGNRLACRAADDGTLIWAVGRGLPVPGGADEETRRVLSGCRFLTAPTASDGRVLAIAEFAAGFWAVCLDAATGRPQWVRFLSHFPETADDRAFVATGSPPAAAGGTAYFLTNAGVLAALDEADGQVQWLLQYPDPASPLDEDLPLRQPPNPVVAAGDRLIVLPSDSPSAMAVDAATGAVLWSAPRWIPGKPAVGNRQVLPWLAGVAGHRVILTGGGGALGLRIEDGKPAWSADGVGSVGRPSLSPDALHVSVPGQGVARLDPATGRLIAVAPLPPATSRPLPLGNLLTVRGRLISAEGRSVAGFENLHDSRRRLSDEIAARPGDPAPRLARGELLLAAALADPARIAEARDDLTEALRLGAGPAARAALCDVGLLAAEAAAGDARIALLQSAAEAADDPVRTAEARMSLAHALARAGRHVRAAEVAQSALAGADADIDGSELPASGRLRRTARPKVSARGLAEAFLRRLIAEHGRSVYATCEAAAAERFAAARAVGDPEAMRRVLAEHPVSSAAGAFAADLAAAERLAARRLLDAGFRAAALGRRYGAPAAAAESRRPIEPGAGIAALKLLESAEARLRELAEDPARTGSPERAGALAGLLDLAMDRRDRDAARTWFAELAAERPGAPALRRWGPVLYPRGVPARPVGPELPAARLTKLRTLRGGPRDDRWGGPESRIVRRPDGRPLTIDDAVVIGSPGGFCLVDPADGSLVWRTFEFGLPPVPKAFPDGDAPPPGEPRGMILGDRVVIFDGLRTVAAFTVNGGRRLYAPVEVPPSPRVPATEVDFDGAFALRIAEPADDPPPGSGLRVLGIDAVVGIGLPPLALPAGAAGDPVVAGRKPLQAPWGRAIVDAGRMLFLDPAARRITGTVEATDQEATIHPVPQGLLTLHDGSAPGAVIDLWRPDGRRAWSVRAASRESTETQFVAADREQLHLTEAGGPLVALHALSTADGRRLWKRWMDDPDLPHVLSLIRDGPRLLVLETRRQDPPLVPFEGLKRGRYSGCRLLCLSAADGSLLWRRSGDPVPETLDRVSDPIIHGRQVLVAVREARTMRVRIDVLDRVTGRLLAADKPVTGEHPAGEGAAGRRHLRASLCGMPAPFGRFLLVETPGGVEVWGEK